MLTDNKKEDFCGWAKQGKPKEMQKKRFGCPGLDGYLQRHGDAAADFLRSSAFYGEPGQNKIYKGRHFPERRLWRSWR
jgi:hypothetical protein